MESEANLDEELKRFEAVATEPQLLPKLTACAKFFQTLLPLLLHENTDIAGRIVTLLADLVEMDEDISPGRYDDLFEFCEALLGNQLIGLLKDNMRRLNEEDADEADAVFKSLGIIESLVEVDATLLEDAKSMNSLQSFLVTRYYNSIPSQNRDYAAELTAMLIASVSEFREAFVTSDQGVDLTLAAVAPFKDRDPQDADEAEYFENLFDILCAASLEPTGQERFLQAQGTHLLALLLKQVNMARIRALKLLSYVLTGPKFAQEACDAFVDALGLKVIFPIFMKKGQASLAKYKNSSLPGARTNSWRRS
jgi:beta-catenin-like protein 1